MAGAGGGGCPAGGNDFQWCFSQVKGAVDEDVAEDVCSLHPHSSLAGAPQMSCPASCLLLHPVSSGSVWLDS
uniref:Protein phosphatase 2, regulatory subunit B, delta n=1 Tax=Mus musculus TaxID=10090 RepID=D6RCH9_MOUSE